MEQPSGKKEKVMLALGLGFAFALAAAQYFSPVASAFTGGRDLRLALLSEGSQAVLVWHTGTATVNAVSFSRTRHRKGASAFQRASELLALTGGVATAPADVFFVSLSTGPDMEALWDTMNGWRSAPRKFFRAAAWTARLHRDGATNIPPFGLFVLFSELARLNSSNFILTEASRQVPPEEEPEQVPAPVLRVEVFNASGRTDLAVRAARHLRAAGFDVLTVSSYAKIEKHSRVVAYGDTAPALKLRTALGLDGLEITERPEQRSVAAAGVVLGVDFNDGVLGSSR